ncbi:radical SAM/SPASM domain-containing protein [uncultured Brachyspira sp.]|uniref:radical SAM/SPASM domain-containing protein n=1 Tax=uncultured Brachyspira sp. TaxID=221953 RepID=UPI00242B9DB2|nr:radical SAM/SPASM domain-containing protein [uncultured Brachyspira sp.]
MDKKTIDKIAWWIPIKNIRKKFREKMYNTHIIPDYVISYNNKAKEVAKKTNINLVQIETINRCNNDCQFCPVSVGNDKRKYHKMTDELFLKIINNLQNMNYSDSISLFCNNEPFLDNRIVDFFKITKEKLPNAFHYIMTNGLVVTLEQFKESYKYLDMFLIDNYNNNGELNKNTKIIYDFCIENPQYKDKTVILMRRKDEILTSRAGNSPNRQSSLKKVNYLCAIPYYQFIIRPDGKISLCCNDAWGEMTLGDLNKNEIEQIWNSNRYNSIRKKLLKSRNNIKLCEYCDFVDWSIMFSGDSLTNLKKQDNNILK